MSLMAARSVRIDGATTIPGLQGSLVALATPFRDGRLDECALMKLCQRQIDAGSRALVVCGSTGEASSLSLAEHVRVVAIAVEVASRRIPVIAGCGGPTTEAAVALATSGARHGAAGLLCAPPPYIKPTQEGIIAHVRAVSQASNQPVVLYDVPSRAGVAIADVTVARLFESNAIVALKDATADLARVSRLRAMCGGELVQLSGDDATAVAYLAMGGHGWVSVTANVVPRLCALCHTAWDDGDLHLVGQIRDLLAPLHEALFVESNPIPLKAALFLVSLASDQVRLPLTRAIDTTRHRLAQILVEVLRAEESWTTRPRLAAFG